MTIDALLSKTEHRPWPLPQSPWVMTQHWGNLLFAHWPVSAQAIQAMLPSGSPAELTVDTFEGNAWLGIVPFEMACRLRGTAFTFRFLELNVRTYVSYRGKPGVLFFSLDANHWPTVLAARLTYALPYRFAKMTASRVPSDSTLLTRYACRRQPCNTKNARFAGVYEPTSPVFQAQPGTLAHWLTERYCLYAVDRHKRLCRADVHHAPWPLQQAMADITENSMSNLALPDIPPLLYYSAGVDVVVWPLKLV